MYCALGKMQDLSKTRDGKPVAPIFRGFQRDLPFSYEHQMENLCDPVRCTAARWTVGCKSTGHCFLQCHPVRTRPCDCAHLHCFFIRGAVAEPRCSGLPQAHFNFVHHGVAADK